MIGSGAGFQIAECTSTVSFDSLTITYLTKTKLSRVSGVFDMKSSQRIMLVE